MGYHRVGFDVVGVDIDPQPNYPFEFHQADALTFPMDGFDVVHASPPCQAHTTLRFLQNRSYQNLIAPIREVLKATGRPYVIENVPGAPMSGRGITLCGSMFGLVTKDGSGQLRRHRHFESNIPLWVPASCNHCLPAVPVYGGGGRSHKGATLFQEHHRREVMGIDWMDRREISQAIPPAYTEWIGKWLIRFLRNGYQSRMYSIPSRGLTRREHTGTAWDVGG